ncbi:HET-domain-containing protein [Xylariaceae sp. FL1019]|nr:HET-domain-containing protein [Xylariaceae sp. FL1019]
MGFNYEALPSGPHIRVLKVKPNPEHALICQLKVMCLDDDNHDEYTAISYTWDRTSMESVSTLTFTDGQTMPLSPTLSSLFETMKNAKPGNDGETGFSVWIDALCINEADSDERAAQVSMMDRVYSRAACVVVWLGTSDPVTQRAFRFMRSRRKLRWPNGWPDELSEQDHAGLEMLLRFLANPWFRRAWVVQEVTLSNNVWMQCGDDAEGFAIFTRCVWAIWKFFRNWDAYGDEDRAMLGLWSATRLLDIRERFIDHSKPLRWDMLLQSAFRWETTDHRDSVFALRGLADRAPPIPAPSYTIPIGQEPEYSEAVEKVYRETAAALLCHGTSLDLLALAGLERTRSPGLASWVPDYRHFSFSEPYVVCEAANWDAGGPLKEQPQLLSPDRLRIQVYSLDVVESVCPECNAYSVLEQQKTMEQVLKLKDAQQTGASRSDWLDELAMDLIFGLDIDEQPAGPEYVKLFHEWLHWLESSTSQSDLSEIKHNAYIRALEQRVDGWKAFGTRKGFFCIGPPEIEVGDTLCLVAGCRLPLVLRNINEGEVTSDEFILVGWCYAAGLMSHGANQQPYALEHSSTDHVILT